jgi:hypothetical protein
VDRTVISSVGRGAQVVECHVLIGTILEHLASSVLLYGAGTPEQVR